MTLVPTSVLFPREVLRTDGCPCYWKLLQEARSIFVLWERLCLPVVPEDRPPCLRIVVGNVVWMDLRLGRILGWGWEKSILVALFTVISNQYSSGRLWQTYVIDHIVLMSFRRASR